MFAFLLILGSCSKDESNDSVNRQGEKNEETKMNVEIKKVCIDWGTSVAEVEKMMNSNYGWRANSGSTTSIFHYSRGFLTGNEWGDYYVVSYEFTDNSLTSSSAIISYDTTDIDGFANLYLPGYTCLGQRNSTYVYADESKNTMAVVYVVSKNDKDYMAIGLTSL